MTVRVPAKDEFAVDALLSQGWVILWITREVVTMTNDVEKVVPAYKPRESMRCVQKF